MNPPSCLIIDLFYAELKFIFIRSLIESKSSCSVENRCLGDFFNTIRTAEITKIISSSSRNV